MSGPNPWWTSGDEQRICFLLLLHLLLLRREKVEVEAGEELMLHLLLLQGEAVIDALRSLRCECQRSSSQGIESLVRHAFRL